MREALFVFAVFLTVLAGAAFAAGDSLYIHVIDCVFPDITPDSGFVRLDTVGSVGIAIDSGYCDTAGNISKFTVFPGVKYKISVEYDDHSGYWDVDSIYFSYGDTAKAVHVSICAPPAYPGAMAFTIAADPTITALDTIIVTWTNANGTDTSYIDTCDNGGMAYLPAWDALNVGTTYRVYVDDQADTYTDRYYSIVWDTLIVAPLRLSDAPYLPIDTLIVRMIDPKTQRPPTALKTLTAQFWGLSASGRLIADTLGTTYWWPLNLNQTWTSGQDGIIYAIVPTGTCWNWSLAGTTMSNEHWCIDSTWAIQAYSPR